MFRATLIAACLGALLLDAVPADAGRPRYRSTTRYPRVYGWTGRPYGPTQAHYQYRRQYGRPWHGYGGINTSYRFATPYGYSRYHRNRYCGFFGPALYSYSYTSLGFPLLGLGYSYYGAGLYNSILYNSAYGYSPYYYYSSPPISTYGPVLNYAPTVVPRATRSNAFNNAAVREALIRRGVPANQIGREIPVTIKRSGPSALKAKRHALRLLPQGDEFLRKRDYRRAASRYHSAVILAPDLAEAHFRLGYARAGQGEFEEAAQSFRKGLQIDPRWPTRGENLTEVYGAQNAEATARIVGDATDWTKRNIRDPRRLFLLGVLLHFADRTESATLLFTAARKQGDRGDHLTAFLNPIVAEQPDVTRQAKKPTQPERPAAKPRSEQPKLLVPPLPRR